MPFLSKPVVVATAPGASSIQWDKPVGGKVIIKAIHISSNKNPTFVEVKAYLGRLDHTEHQIGVLHKWAVSLEQKGWDLNREWPDGWRLHVRFTTQTNADTSWYTVEYEIAPAPPGRRWF